MFKQRLEYKETKSIVLGYNSYFCAYCGKQCKESLEKYDDRDMRSHWYCDCESAEKELEIKTEILNIEHEAHIAVFRLKQGMPKENCDITQRLKYEYELKQLQKKFGRN